jgi:hypothetical protein
MHRSITVRGTLSDARHIELAEPVDGFEGEIELTIRAAQGQSGEDVFALIARLSSGERQKADIDQQVLEDRELWKDR